MRSYLHKRLQRVEIEGQYSEFMFTNVTCGVPQETVLEPLLFNVYVYMKYKTDLIQYHRDIVWFFIFHI